MKLDKFLKAYTINVKAFCEKAGVSRNTLKKVIRGETVSLETAFLIQDATEGKVTCEDMRPTKLKQKSTKTKADK